MGERPISVTHIAMLNLPLSQSPGFKSQLQSEHEASKQLPRTIKWSTLLIAPSANAASNYDGFDVPVQRIPRLLKWRILKRLYLWSKVVQASRESDYVLVRHSMIDPFEALVCSARRNIVIVHHTKSGPELTSSGRKTAGYVERILVWFGKVTGTRSIGVTRELSNYVQGPKTPRSLQDVFLPNGVQFDLTAGSADRRPTNPIEAVFVCSRFQEWHGLERLLEAARLQNASAGDTGREDIIFHLIGELTADQDSLVDESCGPRVGFIKHGVLDGRGVEEVSARASLGIGSLALDVQGMREATTLKVREYLRSGLPVYATHQDAALPQGFPYFRFDSDVSIPAILTFGHQMQGVTRMAVREASRPYTDKAAIMERFVSKLPAAGGNERSKFTR
ncbi:MAG: hypothetical protein WAS54_07600 [Scrofimicrobium sp.]